MQGKGSRGGGEGGRLPALVRAGHSSGAHRGEGSQSHGRGWYAAGSGLCRRENAFDIPFVLRTIGDGFPFHDSAGPIPRSSRNSTSMRSPHRRTSLAGETMPGETRSGERTPTVEAGAGIIPSTTCRSGRSPAKKTVRSKLSSPHQILTHWNEVDRKQAINWRDGGGRLAIRAPGGRGRQGC